MFSVIKPLLTEKSAAKMSDGLYVLQVAEDATKTSVAQDVATMYKVDAVSVRIVNTPDRRVRFRGRKGVQGGFKKAYVQLKKGQELPGFEVKKEKETGKDKKAAKETK